MAKLSAEQVAVVSPVVKENAATMTDKAMVALVKEKCGVDVTQTQVTEVRQGLGIRKTRGKNSRVLAEGEVYVPKHPSKKAKKAEVASDIAAEDAPVVAETGVEPDATQDQLPF